MFDGQTQASTYYIPIIATFLTNDAFPCGYSISFLSCPLENETTHSSEQHTSLLNWVLGLYVKSINNAVAIIRDNSVTNMALARLLDPGFVGCSSHINNFSVKYMIEKHTVLVGKIKMIMLSPLSGKTAQKNGLGPGEMCSD